jgi:hypothetical protein
MNSSVQVNRELKYYIKYFKVGTKFTDIWKWKVCQIGLIEVVWTSAPSHSYFNFYCNPLNEFAFIII